MPIKWPTEQKFGSYSNDQYNKFNALQFQFFTSKLVLDVSKLARLKLPAHNTNSLEHVASKQTIRALSLSYLRQHTHIHTSPPFRLKQDKGRKISSCMVLKLYDLTFNKFLNQISTDNITFLAVMHETTIIILTFADLCIFLCNALHQKFLKFIL